MVAEFAFAPLALVAGRSARGHVAEAQVLVAEFGARREVEVASGALVDAGCGRRVERWVAVAARAGGFGCCDRGVARAEVGVGWGIWRPGGTVEDGWGGSFNFVVRTVERGRWVERV